MNQNLPSEEDSAGESSWRPTVLHVPAQLRAANGTIKDCTIDWMEYMGLDSKYGHDVKQDLALQARGHDNPIVFPHITCTAPASIQHSKEHLVQQSALQGFKLVNKVTTKDRIASNSDVFVISYIKRRRRRRGKRPCIPPLPRNEIGRLRNPFANKIGVTFRLHCIFETVTGNLPRGRVIPSTVDTRVPNKEYRRNCKRTKSQKRRRRRVVNRNKKMKCRSGHLCSRTTTV